MELTIKEWEDIFDINGVDIVDVKGWNPYALAEGLAGDSTLVELSEIEIARLSPLSVEKIETLIRKLK